MSTAQEQGTAAGFFKAGLEGATPIVDLASIVMGGASAVKAGSKAIEAGINLSENRLKKSTHWSSQYPTVKIEEIGMKWGGNIKLDQGDPFEKFVGNKYFSKSTRTPDTFKTFYYFDEATGSAVSVKTLNTLSNSNINDPKRIYSSIRNNIDDKIKFQIDAKNDIQFNKNQITSREVMVAIPEKTHELQWEQIYKAIQYGADNGVKVTIVKVK